MKTHAFGTKLAWNEYEVASLTSINGIEISTDSIDVTTHQSEGAYKESIPGLLDAGDVSVEGFFEYSDGNGQVAMITDMNNRVSRSAAIIFPASTGCAWLFTAYITSLKVGDVTTDNAIPFTATLKVTGKPTFAMSGLSALTGLVITTATLYPTFSASVYDYTATSTGASVTVTPTKAGSVIKVNGSTVNSGTASAAISLGSVGTVTLIQVVVTETGKAPRLYTVRVAKTA